MVPFTDDDTSITFKWRTFEGENFTTVWNPYEEKTDFFLPSNKDW
jgi:hypothetical protein